MYCTSCSPSRRVTGGIPAQLPLVDCQSLQCVPLHPLTLVGHILPGKLLLTDEIVACADKWQVANIAMHNVFWPLDAPWEDRWDGVAVESWDPRGSQSTKCSSSSSSIAPWSTLNLNTSIPISSVRMTVVYKFLFHIAHFIFHYVSLGCFICHESRKMLLGRSLDTANLRYKIITKHVMIDMPARHVRPKQFSMLCLEVKRDL